MAVLDWSVVCWDLFLNVFRLSSAAWVACSIFPKMALYIIFGLHLWWWYWYFIGWQELVWFLFRIIVCVLYQYNLTVTIFLHVWKIGWFCSNWFMMMTTNFKLEPNVWLLSICSASVAISFLLSFSVFMEMYIAASWEIFLIR